MKRLAPYLLTILFAILLSATVQPAPSRAAVPAPTTAQAASVPVALTDFDVRFVATITDGAGQVFVAVPFPGSRIKICKLVDKALSCFHDLSGEKMASVSLTIRNADLIVFYSSRPPGAIDGPFPLMYQELIGVATPAADWPLRSLVHNSALPRLSKLERWRVAEQAAVEAP